MLRAFLQYEDVAWKSRFKTEDGEQLLLLPSANASVSMIVGTRRDDLIKAINTQTLQCEDLSARLRQDEEAGFAGYVAASDRMLGMASSLRGPKAAAFGRLVNQLLADLGAGDWVFETVPVGTSVTIQEARQIEFVSRTTVRVEKGTSLYRKIQETLACEDDNVQSIELVLRATKSKNIADSVEAIANSLGDDPVKKMILRARAAIDDEITDFFVAANGQVAEHVARGTDAEIAHTIASKFAQNTIARDRVVEMMAQAAYTENNENFGYLGDVEHWRRTLPGIRPQRDGAV